MYLPGFGRPYLGSLSGDCTEEIVSHGDACNASVNASAKRLETVWTHKGRSNKLRHQWNAHRLIRRPFPRIAALIGGSIALMRSLGATQPGNDARYFVVSGGFHGASASLTQVDWLTSLINWVEHRVAPSQLVYDYGTSSTIPVCQYPSFPRYKGHGDYSSASSFYCSRH
jgi:hypothetical protein